MASKRKLKKAINFVTNELVIEMYVLGILKNVNEEKLDELTAKALQINNEYISRINHIDGKEDSKIVRSYFNSLRKDWENSINELVKKIETIN